MSIPLEKLSPQAQKQILEKLKIQKMKPEKQTKFHNIPTTVADIHFDSQKEAARFQELLLLKQQGKIQNLKLQVDYTLQEAYTTCEGKRIRAIRFRADFAYEERVGEGWKKVVEDVKSKPTKTKVYQLKMKLMAEKYGIIIREI